MWWKNKYLLVTMLLMLASIPAFADHGLGRSDDGLGMFLCIAGLVIVCTVTSFIFAAVNFSEKSKKLNIASVILGFPLGIATLILFCVFPVLGFITGAVFVLLNTFIYKSYKPRQEKGNVQ